MSRLLLIGPPGAGKTMLARAYHERLPQISGHEAIEVAWIYHGARMPYRLEPSVRPFRAPHYTCSERAMVGQLRRLRRIDGEPYEHFTPGEVNLAHRGVLFLDELEEWSRHTIQAIAFALKAGRTYGGVPCKPWAVLAAASTFNDRVREFANMLGIEAAP